MRNQDPVGKDGTTPAASLQQPSRPPGASLGKATLTGQALPSDQNLEGQLNHTLKTQEPTGTERLQSLREAQLPRVLEAIQVKITQMGQGTASHIPARAIVDVRDPQLGRLRLELSMKEGKLDLQVQHATPEIQAMLESSQDELQQHLEKQGLSLGEFSSGGEDSKDDQSKQQNQGGRQGTHEHDPDKIEVPLPNRRSAPSSDGLIDTVI